MTFIKSTAVGLALLAAYLFAREVSAHGFQLEQNSYITPTAFNLVSNQPYLDNTDDPAFAPAGWNIFIDAFNGSTNVDLNGPLGNANTVASYATFEGFVQQVAGPNGAWTIKSATFNVVSPLYYSDGTRTAAQPASEGTSLLIYDLIATGGSDPTIDPADYPNASTLPSLGGPSISITGTTPFTAGFPVSAEYFHELQKDLYIDPSSAQTYGEYGYAFDVTVTLTPPAFLAALGATDTTLTSPTMVDVFGLTDSTLDYDAEFNPNGGDFVDNASQSQQDTATTFIYDAAISAAAPVPEPSTFVLAALCVGGFGVVSLRRRRAEKLAAEPRS